MRRRRRNGIKRHEIPLISLKALRPSATSGSRGWNVAPWQRVVPLIVGFLLLILAPVLAHAQTDSVAVSWTAPGDDGASGIAARYDLRFATAPITEGTFAAANAVTGVPAPAGAGATEHAIVRGLTRGTTYFFALKTVDDAGNWSAISNVARWDWVLDQAPPASPHGVSATSGSGGVTVRWAASAEPDVGGYSVYRATSAAGPFTRITSALVAQPSYLDATPPAGANALWYAVTASDATGNESAKSAAVAVSFAKSGDVWALSAAYPNPSKAGDFVHLPVNVPASGSPRARIDIVESGGHTIRTFDLRNAAAGPREIVWDGKNDAGRAVAPGVYRAWLLVGNTRLSTPVLRIP